MTNLTEIIESLQELKIIHEQCQRELELMKSFLNKSKISAAQSEPQPNRPIFHTEKIKKITAKRDRKPKTITQIPATEASYIELDKKQSKLTRLESTTKMRKQREKKA